MRNSTTHIGAHFPAPRGRLAAQENTDAGQNRLDDFGALAAGLGAFVDNAGSFSAGLGAFAADAGTFAGAGCIQSKG